MNDRIASLRALAMASRQTGDPQADKLRRESYAQTEGEPAVLREAKAIAHVYRHQAVIIRDGELLVGTSPGLKADPNGPVTPAIFGRQASRLSGPCPTTWRSSSARACSARPETTPRWTTTQS